MIAVDSNILVYAHRRDSPFYSRASTVVRDLAEGRSPWAIPWPCLHEFYAVVTHPRIYDPPSSVEEAVRQIDRWLASPTLVLLGEAPGHWGTLGRMLTSARCVGGQVHDARIAALCAGGGVGELWSADRDFSRYPLRVRNPLTTA